MGVDLPVIMGVGKDKLMIKCCECIFYTEYKGVIRGRGICGHAKHSSSGSDVFLISQSKSFGKIVSVRMEPVPSFGCTNGEPKA